MKFKCKLDNEDTIEVSSGEFKLNGEGDYESLVNIKFMDLAGVYLSLDDAYRMAMEIQTLVRELDRAKYVDLAYNELSQIMEGWKNA